jgi:hypothetical protein
LVQRQLLLGILFASLRPKRGMDIGLQLVNYFAYSGEHVSSHNEIIKVIKVTEAANGSCLMRIVFYVDGCDFLI